MAHWVTGSKYKRLFAAVQKRDGMICRWCFCEVRKVPSGQTTLEPDMVTLDHLTDRADDRANTVENLVMACYECNQRRSKASGVSCGAGLLTEAELIALM